MSDEQPPTVRLTARSGRYNSERVLSPNGTELFTINWGQGLTITAYLPGLTRHHQMLTTDYALAREQCGQLMQTWLMWVCGITAAVEVTLVEDGAP